MRRSWLLVPESPDSVELTRLRAAVAALEAVNARLDERIVAMTEAHRAKLASRDALITAQAERIAELECQLRRDSSKPPSSDSPYKKMGRDRSLRQKTGRRPGKQPGAPGATPGLSDHPDEVIDAGGVLPGYTGVLMRDGYAGYAHLNGAAHAWCGAHLLRDLNDIYDFEPARQAWASDMASLLTEANEHASRARQAGADRLDDDVLAGLLARRVTARFRDHEDMALRFVTDMAVTDFTNNEAEPVSAARQGPAARLWRLLD